MKKSIVKIALTGGIASGKSTVARLFAELGLRTIDLDVLAKEVTSPNSAGLAKLLSAFGDDILSNGRLNRDKLRQLLLADLANKQAIERILHPLIIKEMQRQTQSLTAQNIEAVLIEVPLLMEANMQSLFAKILVIDCPAWLQKERLQQRKELDRTMIDKLLKNQASNADRIKIPNAIIINNTADLTELRLQVSALYQQLFNQ